VPNPFKLNKDKQVVIPTGGDFPPTGLIGLWSAAVMTTFSSEVDLKEEGITTFNAVRQMGDSGWARYYWLDHDAAKDAAKELKREYGTTSLWVFEAESTSILNFASDKAREAFQGTITYDGCTVVTLRSRKRRHQLHMLALPALVRAYAEANGWDVPEFELIKTLCSQDTMFTDDFQARMIGDPNNPDAFDDSELWKYRAELWKALGEENAHAYQPIGHGTNYDVTSERLNEAIQPLHCQWDDPVYLRLVTVPDPRVDATYEQRSSGDIKRLRIPCVMDIYNNKEEAEAAAAEDRARMGGGRSSDGETSTTSSSGLPPYPENWAYSDAAKKDWHSVVAGLKEGKKRPVVIARLKGLSSEDLENEIAATVADVEAWWDHV
jgi:hypothetical protein